jgi:hypothetical protein
MKTIYSILSLCLLISLNAFAQSESLTPDQEKVNKVINELFDGYRAGDSSRVAATFTKDAMMQSIFVDTLGQHKITDVESLKAFTNYIGGGFKVIHDERLWDTQIHVDDLFATLWTNYAFYLGDKFNHCGTETFLLRKVDNKWKIFYLVDTRQKTGCKVPPEIKK